MVAVAMQFDVPTDIPSGTLPREPSGRALVLAEQDLEWWYGPRVAELGEGAQVYESGGSHVFDACEVVTGLCGVCSSCLLHAGMNSWRRRAAIKKAARIGPRLWGMPTADRAVAAALYAPRMFSLHLRFAFAVERGPAMVLLVGAVLLAPAAMSAYVVRHKKQPQGAQLLEWIDRSLDPRQDAKRAAAALPKWAKDAREEAKVMRTKALKAYALAG